MTKINPANEMGEKAGAMFFYVPEAEFLFNKAAEMLDEHQNADQVVCLLTKRGAEPGFGLRSLALHSLFSGGFEQEEEELIRQMTEDGDTKVEYIVCMFGKNVSISGAPVPDLPSYNLRKRLLDIDKRNADALILLRVHYPTLPHVGEAYSFKKLSATMPPEKK